MALADPTRRQLLARLAEGDALVGELAAPFAMSLPAISKHLGILERADLIVREKHGRTRRCRLQAQALADAAEWLNFYQGFWNTRLARLADTLHEENKS